MTMQSSLLHLLITLLLVVAIIPAAVDALSSSSSSSSSVRNNNNDRISQTIINSIAATATAKAIPPTKLVATTASSVSVSVPTKLKIRTKFILMDTINGGNIGSAARAMKTMGFQNNLILVNPKDGLSVKHKKRTKESTSGAMNVLHNSKIVTTVDEALHCSFDDDDEDDNNSKEISSMDEDENKQDNDNDDDDDTINDNENNIITIVCGTGMPIDMSHEREEQLYIPPRQFFEELLLLSTSASASASTASIASIASTTTTTAETTTTTTVTLHLSLLFGNEKYGMNQNDIQNYCNIMLGIPTNPKFGSLNLASAVQIIAYDWRMAINDNGNGNGNAQ